MVNFTYKGFTPGTEPLVPSDPKVWWTAERVRTTTSTEKISYLCRESNRNSSDCPARLFGRCTYYGVTLIRKISSNLAPFCLYLGATHSNLGREIDYPEVLRIFCSVPPSSKSFPTPYSPRIPPFGATLSSISVL